MAYVFLPFMLVAALMGYSGVPGAAVVLIIGIGVSVYAGWWLSR